MRKLLSQIKFTFFQLIQIFQKNIWNNNSTFFIIKIINYCIYRFSM